MLARGCLANRPQSGPFWRVSWSQRRASSWQAYDQGPLWTLQLVCPGGVAPRRRNLKSATSSEGVCCRLRIYSCVHYLFHLIRPFAPFSPFTPFSLFTASAHRSWLTEGQISNLRSPRSLHPCGFGRFPSHSSHPSHSLHLAAPSHPPRDRHCAGVFPSIRLSKNKNPTPPAIGAVVGTDVYHSIWVLSSVRSEYST